MDTKNNNDELYVKDIESILQSKLSIITLKQEDKIELLYDKCHEFIRQCRSFLYDYDENKNNKLNEIIEEKCIEIDKNFISQVSKTLPKIIACGLPDDVYIDTSFFYKKKNTLLESLSKYYRIYSLYEIENIIYKDYRNIVFFNSPLYEEYSKKKRRGGH